MAAAFDIAAEIAIVARVEVILGIVAIFGQGLTASYRDWVSWLRASWLSAGFLWATSLSGYWLEARLGVGLAN